MSDEAEVFNEVRDVSEIGAKHYETPAERQLNLARYAMHRVRLAMYSAGVHGGNMTEDEAQHHYDESMRNFDGILSNDAEAPNTGTYAAAMKDMAEGWRLLR